MSFTLTQPNCWFEGYWWWVANSGQSTSGVKCALWSQTNSTPFGLVVPGSVVTSGTLLAGQWNYIPLSTPIELSLYDQLIAAVGVNGAFPETHNFWGSSDTGAAGITDGPLTAYSAPSGSYPNPYGTPQGCFAYSTSVPLDPSTTMPGAPDSDANFWVDVQISDTAPPGWFGPYRLWPNKGGADVYTTGDSAVDYNIGTEIQLSQACYLHKVWIYVPAGSATLPTTADVWAIGLGGLTGTNVASNDSPDWKNIDGTTATAAAGGWIYSSMSDVVMAAGKYRVTVYNANGSSGSWGAKRFGYWGTSSGSVGLGVPALSAWGVGGITSGPIYAPDTPNASTTYEYNSTDTTNGNTTTEPGQSVFWQGPPNDFPNQYVDALYQNYWVDIEVTQVVGADSSAFLAFF